MITYQRSKIPSLVKKYLMAITGLILTLFVLGHMLGNLQLFISPDQLNLYAHALQNLPYKGLWVFRIFLLLATVVHIWIAILLTRENRRARPEEYKIKKRVQASLASKTMGISGSIILFFLVFHLLHFTTRTIYPQFKSSNYYTIVNEEKMYNVYKMMVDGFSITWVSIFYIIAMYLLCMHLSHGVSSMFQSLGLRNHKWRPRLNAFAQFYGWFIFLGFIAIPVAVLLSKYTTIYLLPQ